MTPPRPAVTSEMAAAPKGLPMARASTAFISGWKETSMPITTATAR